MVDTKKEAYDEQMECVEFGTVTHMETVYTTVQDVRLLGQTTKLCIQQCKM